MPFRAAQCEPCKLVGFLSPSLCYHKATEPHKNLPISLPLQQKPLQYQRINTQRVCGVIYPFPTTERHTEGVTAAPLIMVHAARGCCKRPSIVAANETASKGSQSSPTCTHAPKKPRQNSHETARKLPKCSFLAICCMQKPRARPASSGLLKAAAVSAHRDNKTMSAAQGDHGCVRRLWTTKPLATTRERADSRRRERAHRASTARSTSSQADCNRSETNRGGNGRQRTVSMTTDNCNNGGALSVSGTCIKPSQTSHLIHPMLRVRKLPDPCGWW